MLVDVPCPTGVTWCALHVRNVDDCGGDLHEMTVELVFDPNPVRVEDRAEGADVIAELITMPDGSAEQGVRLQIFLMPDHVGDPSIVLEPDHALRLGRELIRAARRLKAA